MDHLDSLLLLVDTRHICFHPRPDGGRQPSLRCLRHPGPPPPRFSPTRSTVLVGDLLTCNIMADAWSICVCLCLHFLIKLLEKKSIFTIFQWQYAALLKVMKQQLFLTFLLLNPSPWHSWHDVQRLVPVAIRVHHRPRVLHVVEAINVQNLRSAGVTTEAVSLLGLVLFPHWFGQLYRGPVPVKIIRSKIRASICSLLTCYYDSVCICYCCYLPSHICHCSWIGGQCWGRSSHHWGHCWGQYLDSLSEVWWTLTEAVQHIYWRTLVEVVHCIY